MCSAPKSPLEPHKVLNPDYAWTETHECSNWHQVDLPSKMAIESRSITPSVTSTRNIATVESKLAVAKYLSLGDHDTCRTVRMWLSVEEKAHVHVEPSEKVMKRGMNQIKQICQKQQRKRREEVAGGKVFMKDNDKTEKDGKTESKPSVTQRQTDLSSPHDAKIVPTLFHATHQTRSS